MRRGESRRNSNQRLDGQGSRDLRGGVVNGKPTELAEWRAAAKEEDEMTELDTAKWSEAVERHRERAVPAARQMRTLTDEEAAGLLRSISDSGQLTPVLVLEDGSIVDGVHRSAACELLAIEAVTTTVRSEDPDRMAVELNAARRQLTVFERAQEACGYAARRGVCIEEAARIWSVAERHISRVRRVLAHDDQDLIEELRKGSITVAAAEETVARLEDERRRDAEWKQRAEEAKPAVIDSDGMVAGRERLTVLTTGADLDDVLAVVEHALRNETKHLRVTAGTETQHGDSSYVAWTAPAKRQERWTWRHKTIHAVGCGDAWKKVLPEWREIEVLIRVSRAAAKELGLSEGDHPQEAVAVAVENYAGSSVAVARLEDKLC